MIAFHCFCLIYYMMYHRLTYSWTHIPRWFLFMLRQMKKVSAAVSIATFSGTMPPTNLPAAATSTALATSAVAAPKTGQGDL